MFYAVMPQQMIALKRVKTEYGGRSLGLRQILAAQSLPSIPLTAARNLCRQDTA